MKRSKLFRLILLLLGVWVVLLSILYFSSNKYRDHLLIYLKSQLDKHLETEIQVQKDNIRVSLFRNFPNASITLRGVLIKSSPSLEAGSFIFKGADTLLYTDKLSLVFNLGSMLTRKYDLKRIIIESAQLNILYDKNKNNNFKILKQSEKESKDTLALNLSEIQLRKTHINFIDLKADVRIRGFTEKSVLSGKFSGKNFEFDVTSGFEDSWLFVDKEKYLGQEKLKARLKIIRKDDQFTFSDGRVSIFGADISVFGEYNSNNRKYTFTSSINQGNLHKLDFPALNKRLQKLALKAENGKFDFSLITQGTAGNSGVSLKADYQLTSGVFKTTKNGTKFSNVFIRGKYTNGKFRIPLSSKLAIDSIYAVSDKSALHGSLSILNLVKPNITLNLEGVLDLTELMEIEALAKRFKLEGKLEGSLSARGALPDFESFKSSDIENLLLSGNLKLSGGYIKPLTNSLPGAHVSGKLKMSNTEEIFLEDIQLRTGRSDLLISGKIVNLPFFSGNRSVYPTYSCTVHSKMLHIEDLLMSSGEKKNNKQLMVQLPDSLKLIARVNIDDFHFGRFDASAVSGDFNYVPKILRIKNFSMLSHGGEMHSEIVLEQKKEKLIVDCQTNMANVDIGDMFVAFRNFRQHVIEADNLDGKLTGNATVRASWDVFLNPFLEDLSVKSELSILNGELIDYPPMLGLSRFIHVDELKHIQFEQLKTSIVIEDQTVYIPQTIINTSAMSLEGSGQHGFDNAYEYRMQVQLSDILWRKSKKKQPESNEFGYVVDDGLGRTTIPLIVTGKGDNFEVKYDKTTAGSRFREKVKKEGDTWKELLRKDDEAKPEEEEQVVLEWEDAHAEEEPGEGKKVKNNKGKKSDPAEEEEFIIEWEDD